MLENALDMKKRANLTRLRRIFAIVDLNEQHRRVLRLRLEGKTYSEIGRTLNVTEGNAKMMFHRSALRLRWAERTTRLSGMHREVLRLWLQGVPDDAIRSKLTTRYPHLKSPAAVRKVALEAEALLVEDSLAAAGQRATSSVALGSIQAQRFASMQATGTYGPGMSSSAEFTASTIERASLSVTARSAARAARFPVRVIASLLAALGVGALGPRKKE